MRKNETDLIKSSKQRKLTAKGYKFLNKCIDIACNAKGINRYSQDAKPIRDKMKTLFKHLIIDKRYNMEEIKTIIKNRKTEQQITIE